MTEKDRLTLTQRYRVIKDNPLILDTKEGSKVPKRLRNRALLGTTGGFASVLTAMTGAPDQLATATRLSENLHHAPEIAVVGLGLYFFGSALRRVWQLGNVHTIAQDPQKAEEKAAAKAEKENEKHPDVVVKRYTGGYDDGFWGGYYYPYYWWWGPGWNYGDGDHDHHGGHHHGGQGTPDIHHNGGTPAPDAPHGGGAHGVMDVGGSINDAAHQAGSHIGAFGAGFFAGEQHLAEGAAEAAKHVAEEAGNVLSEVGKAASNVDATPLLSGIGETLSHVDWGGAIEGVGHAASGIDWGDALSGVDWGGVDIPDWN